MQFSIVTVAPNSIEITDCAVGKYVRASSSFCKLEKKNLSFNHLSKGRLNDRLTLTLKSINFKIIETCAYLTRLCDVSKDNGTALCTS